MSGDDSPSERLQGCFDLGEVVVGFIRVIRWAPTFPDVFHDMPHHTSRGLIGTGLRPRYGPLYISVHMCHYCNTECTELASVA